MNDNVKKGLVVVVVLVSGIAIGRFTLPAKVVEKEHIVYQEKIVEKKVVVTDVKRDEHKTIIKLEKTSPDGTKTVETRIVDDSTLDKKSKLTDDKSDDITSTTDKEKTTTYALQSTIVSLGLRTDPLGGYDYGLFISKRIVGPFYLGAFGFTDKSFGLSLGLAF